MKTFFQKIFENLVSTLLSFARNHKGVAMTEFALMMPVLVVIAAGSFEVARYALILQKIDRVVATLSDLVARSEVEAMSELEISNIMNSALYIARPFDISDTSMMILTSVEGRAGQAPIILSQRVEGSVSGESSDVGSEVDGNAALPAAFPDAGSGETLADKETLVVAEVIYSYSPFLVGDLGFFEDKVFYRDAYFRPRFTQRITFPSAP